MTGGVAHRTISSAAVSGRSFLYSSHWSGVVGEGDHAVGDRVAGGLVAGHRQHHHEEAELVIGELFFAIDVGVDQRGDDVVAGVLTLHLGHVHGVGEHLHRRLLGVDVELLVTVTGHLVRPAEQLVAILLGGHTQQIGDRLQRQFARHLLDEVTAAVGGGLLGDDLGAPIEFVAQRPRWPAGG